MANIERAREKRFNSVALSTVVRLLRIVREMQGDEALLLKVNQITASLSERIVRHAAQAHKEALAKTQSDDHCDRHNAWVAADDVQSPSAAPSAPNTPPADQNAS